MKNAIVLHGLPSREEYYNPDYPSASNSHWLPWIQKQLLILDIAAATPEVPNCFESGWDVWQKEVERFDIGPETILIGHSMGAGFWVKYLSMRKDLQVGKVVLVAPWVDLSGKRSQDFFADFTIDADLVSRTNGVTIFNSDNDNEVHETVGILRDQIKNIGYKEFHDYGHFTLRSMQTDTFPELLVESTS